MTRGTLRCVSNLPPVGEHCSNYWPILWIPGKSANNRRRATGVISLGWLVPGRESLPPRRLPNWVVLVDVPGTFAT